MELNSAKIKFARYAVAVLFFLCGFIFSCWATRIPVFKETFKLNEAELGAILFMLPLGSFIALPFAGWAVDRFGSRFMSVVSIILYAVSLYSLSWCTSVFALSASLFLFGFMGDNVNIAMNTQGLDVQHAYDKPILASFHGLWSVGALCGALVGGWSLKRQMTTHDHYLIVLFPVVLVTFITYLFLIPHDDKKEEGKKLLAMPDKALMIIGIICLCCTLCEGAMADWSALYYKEVLNDASKVSTTGFTAYAFTMAVGRFTGDRLISALRYKKVLILDGILIASGMALALASMIPTLVIIGFAMVGFGVSTIIPISYTMAGKSETLKPSVALAAVSTIGFTGFLIGPPIIGFVAHEIGLRSALVIVALLGVCVFLLSKRAVKERGVKA
ncbi:MAG TPA: MFS transporter [Chitinophagaceae bacterium]|nr:MFS transporter [Chitinophagaceae bacterium]